MGSHVQPSIAWQMPDLSQAFELVPNWELDASRKRTYDRPLNGVLSLRPPRERGLYPMASDHQQDDVFDYVMSDTFVSETRTHPYRIGFRSRRYSTRPSIKQLLALPDREFGRYLRNGCRMPHDLLDFRDELLDLRRQLNDLQSQVQALTSSNRETASVSAAERKGLWSSR